MTHSLINCHSRSWRGDNGVVFAFEVVEEEVLEVVVSGVAVAVLVVVVVAVLIHKGIYYKTDSY